MYLDLYKGALSHKINRVDHGLINNKIDTDKAYKLFITINGDGTSFPILSYENQL